MPRLLELFSGTGTLAKAAQARGWETVTIDSDPKVRPDLTLDLQTVPITDLLRLGPFDMVWASPPCESFSVASIGTHWGGGHRAYEPKTEQAKSALRLISHLATIITKLDPQLWYIENPRGVMRKVQPYDRIANRHTNIVLRHTVTYCQYGEERMKPTDIWTNDWNWLPRPACRNGDSCHVRAPRGARTGTQGRTSYLNRSRLPIALCQEILTSAEDVLQGFVVKPC